MRGLDLEKVPTTDKVVALTFDAGANADGVASILKTLRDKDVPGTFFLTGNFVKAFPNESRDMAAYPIGNHTQSHPDLTTLTSAAARAEVDKARATITAVTGQDPRPYFRFPFGARNAATITLVNNDCYVAFRWTVDTLGWQGTSSGMTAAKVSARVIAGLTPGEIVLMHVGSHPSDRSTLDADALPGIIDEIDSAGYSFVTLEAVVPGR